MKMSIGINVKIIKVNIRITKENLSYNQSSNFKMITRFIIETTLADLQV